MAERIYNRGESGELEPLEEERFSTEDELQELIAKHPELLDGEQMRPGDPRRWILITREKGIAETSDAGARWSVDHLVVDQDAIPTLVEVKLGRNSEIRRTIVGQMLEYAAHAAQTWSAEELRQSFEEAAQSSGRDAEEELHRLLQSDGEPDADSFWERVATNLKAQRLRLLFVADEIPDTLERIVEFLNAHMPGIEVLAVEIKQFRGKSTQTLVPRVIGRAANVSASRSTGSRQRLTMETFLKSFDEDSRNAAVHLLDASKRAGATISMGTSGLSIRAQCPRWPYPVTVAWFFPPEVRGWSGTRAFTFGAAIFNYDPAPEEELRAILQNYADSFRGDSFTTEVSGKGEATWAVNHSDASRHIDVLIERLTSVLTELAELKPV